MFEGDSLRKNALKGGYYKEGFLGRGKCPNTGNRRGLGNLEKPQREVC